MIDNNFELVLRCGEKRKEFIEIKWWIRKKLIQLKFISSLSDGRQKAMIRVAYGYNICQVDSSLLLS